MFKNEHFLKEVCSKGIFFKTILRENIIRKKIKQDINSVEKNMNGVKLRKDNYFRAFFDVVMF